MRLKNPYKKGRILEKYFAQELQVAFPSAHTEFKPRVISQSKDFWCLFDGLTFVKTKKFFIFWQSKSNKLPPSKRNLFWKSAKAFQAPNIRIFLLEKHNDYYLYSESPDCIYESCDPPATVLKKLLTKKHTPSL